MEESTQDASGVHVQVPTEPTRIVSLVPSVTETLFALGLGDRVVGVTEWCIHPAQALASVARVKGTKNPDIGAIEALAPDLVIANLEENREVDVRRLRERGLCVWVDFPCSVDEVVDQVRWLAALGAPSHRAGPVLASIERAVQETPLARDRKRCFLAVWKDPWMTVSAATYAHDLLGRLGLENVFANAAERYPRVTLEEIRAHDPEVVLLPDEPYSFAEADVESLRDDLSQTTAARDGAIHVVDGTLTFWHGPRTGHALREGLGYEGAVKSTRKNARARS